jgi:UDP-glucose 4-epimerase
MRAPRADRQRLRGQRRRRLDAAPGLQPYGLSKGLTAAAAASYADREGFTFEKFVIPNPLGPYEELRFTAYLMKTWLAGETARVQTPRYVRDNIHVSLLAKA